MINCLGALIRRKQKLTKANFKEWKSFPSAGQVIIQLKLDALEPARSMSQKKTFPVPRARRAASEVLGFVPSLPPIPMPPRTPRSVLLSGPVPGERQTLLLRAASARKPPPRQWGCGKCWLLQLGSGERQPSAAGRWKSQLRAFPWETLLIPRKN